MQNTTTTKMKLTTTLFTLCFLMLTSLNLVAQKKADELLKEVIDKTNAYKTIEVFFSYRMVNESAGIDEVKEGKVMIKGDAYKLMIAGQTVISDGKTVWTYLSESDEVMVSDADHGEEAITPSKILTSYYNDYKASFVNDKANAALGLKTIELKPSKGKKFTKIQIGIDERKHQIANFTLFESNNTFIYSISKMNPDVKMDVKLFAYNKDDYPTAEVIDMR